MAFDHVLHHEIIPIVLKSTVTVTCPWSQFMGTNRKPTPLSVICSLCQVNRAYRNAVEACVEHSALRLAFWDLGQLQGPKWFPDAEFLCHQFEATVKCFRKSWVTSIPLSHRLRKEPLKNLTIPELLQLRDILQDLGSKELWSLDEARLHLPHLVYVFPH